MEASSPIFLMGRKGSTGASDRLGLGSWMNQRKEGWAPMGHARGRLECELHPPVILTKMEAPFCQPLGIQWPGRRFFQGDNV